MASRRRPRGLVFPAAGEAGTVQTCPLSPVPRLTSHPTPLPARDENVAGTRVWGKGPGLSSESLVACGPLPRGPACCQTAWPVFAPSEWEAPSGDRAEVPHRLRVTESRSIPERLPWEPGVIFFRSGDRADSETYVRPVRLRSRERKLYFENEVEECGAGVCRDSPAPGHAAGISGDTLPAFHA